MAGYTRNDTGNNIADGNVINASDLDGEYNAIEAAFNESTGHTHDGTSAEGAPITKVGPVQDVEISATTIQPKTASVGQIDLGASGAQFKDLYIDGLAYIDGLGENLLVNSTNEIQFRDSTLKINSSADGQLDIDADTELELTAPIVDINASTSVNISNDLKLDSDSAILSLGADSEVTLTHLHNVGTELKVVNATTSSVTDILDLQVESSGTPAVGIGTGLTFSVETAGGNVETAGAIRTVATGLTPTSEELDLVFYSMRNGSLTEAFRYDSDGDALDITGGLTTTAGIDVTGTVTADGFLKDNQTANFKIVDFGGSSTEIAVETGGQLNITTEGNNPIEFYTNDTKRLQIEGDGDVVFNDLGNDCDFRVESDDNANALFVEGSSGNVGIGDTPQSFAKLQVKTDTNKQLAMFSNTDGATLGAITDVGASTTLRLAGSPLIMTGAGGSGGEHLRLDTSGNLGLKVTPSAWFSNVSAYQFSSAGAMWGLSGQNNVFFTGNDFIDSSAVSTYIRDGHATRYQQLNGVHYWYTAPSGTGGDPITYTESMRVGSSAVTVNETSADIDFRVESDNDANAFFVRGSDGNIGIGTNDPDSVPLHIKGASNREYLTIENTASAGTDEAGLRFKTPNSYFQIFSYGDTRGLIFRDNSAATERMRFSATELVVNDPDANFDFRVASDGNANAIFVDAANNRVGIRTGSPDALFQVNHGTTGGGAGQGGARIGRTDSQYWDFSGDASKNYLTTTGGKPSRIGTDDDQKFEIAQNAAERIGIDSGEVAVNEGSNDVNFRVESDGNANMLFVDAANNAVCIGTASQSDFATLTVEADGEGLALSRTNTYNQDWRFNISHSNTNEYGTLFLVSGPTTEQSTAGFHVIDANADRRISMYGSGSSTPETVINESSADRDFRVETDSVSEAFVVNAGANNVRANGFKWLNTVEPFKISGGTQDRNVRLNNLTGEYYAKIYIIGLNSYTAPKYFTRIIEVVGYGAQETFTVISNNQYGPGDNTPVTVTAVDDGILNLFIDTGSSNYRFAVLTEMIYGGVDAYVTVDGTNA